MSDTIELLEAIGTNAALRHASPEELAHTLAQADASDGLKAAALSGDSSLLSAELGHKPMQVPQDTHSPSHEEPDHDHGEDDPGQPSKPDHSEPSRDR
ncbi:MAG: hypothetical protein WA777_17585 [Rhodanobacter sp.]